MIWLEDKGRTRVWLAKQAFRNQGELVLLLRLKRQVISINVLLDNRVYPALPSLPLADGTQTASAAHLLNRCPLCCSLPVLPVSPDNHPLYDLMYYACSHCTACATHLLYRPFTSHVPCHS